LKVNEDTKHAVVIEMPEHNTGQMGGTQRLGKRTTVFKSTVQNSKISEYSLKQKGVLILILIISLFE